MTLPLADTHVHLLAGLDDGPPDADIALAMCRMLVAEGAGHATALAHQNHGYPENTADRLRAAVAALRAVLSEKKVPLSVHPTGEIMLSANTLDEWRSGKLLSVGDHRQWLLVEMPHTGFV
ncbi:MAG TPA: CpsB/CapC family capsule biosynthesis tyrosine phosphatase, partial [Gemmata sp.]